MISMTMPSAISRRAALCLLTVSCALAVTMPVAAAQDATTVSLSIKDRKFQPSEITVPAGKAVVLRIRNLDATPAEFESVTLRVEKVIAPHGEGVIRLRPLEAGAYKFFDDFHPETRGVLVAR